MVLKFARLSLGFACVVAPLAATASGCTTVVTNNPLPDASTTPVPTNDGGPVGDGAVLDGGPRADGVIRDLSYYQLTAKTEHLPASPRIQISGNGQRVVFSTRDAGSVNRIWVVETNGGTPVLVDTTPATGGLSITAISDDGNTIVSTDGREVRVAGNTGVAKGKIIFQDGEISNVGVNATGTEVYFVMRRNNAFPPPSNAPVQRGLYKMAPTGGADITAITQILSPNQVAPLVGVTDADKVFPFASCGGSGGGNSGLAYSADGSKMYVGIQVEDKMAVIATSSAGGGAKLVVPPVTEGFKSVNSVATNRDGSKLAVRVSNASAAGGEIAILNADGTGRTKLVDQGGPCGTPISLSDDGKVIGDGNSARVISTEGKDPWPVLAPTGASPNGFFFISEPDGGESMDMVMSQDGKRFAYLNSEGNGVPRHIGLAALDSSALGAVPTVSSPTVSRSSITRDTATVNGPRAYVSAKVAGTSPFVGSVFFTKGAVENTGISNGSFGLFDDGKNKDTTAGDGTYTGPEAIYATKDAVVGPRVLRIKAEVKDTATSKRSAHAVDFGPFAVE